MERKGWGLTVDSDPTITLLPNSNRTRGVMFPGFDIPVSLSRSAPVDENRKPIKEVDFLSDKNEPKGVNKENSHERAPRIDLDTGLHLRITNSGSGQSTVDDGVQIYSNEEANRAKHELFVLQAELKRVNAENQSLTSMLSQVSSSHNALQMHVRALMQQQQNFKGKEQELEVKFDNKKQEVVSEIMDNQLMKLRQSMRTETSNDHQSQSSSEERTHSSSQIVKPKNELVPHDPHQDRKNKGVNKESSPESESWVPNKVPRLSEPESANHTTEATMRKVRVSVRARSEAPMITDGCQWRKYGQKMAKGNPCPRAYYRCTMAIGCPVRKQVQRCAEDNEILITTYEGTHNHPLPPAAVAMVSTTSAAANMLLSGSMPSADGLMNPNFLARAILPCSSSLATISASAPFPTVTLDLTHNPNPLQLPPQFNAPFGNVPIRNIFGQLVHNQSRFSGLQMSQEMDSAQLGQHNQNHTISADTLNATTAAIAADPNFTAALAAAINSLISGHQSSSNTNNTTSTATTNTTGSNNKVGGFPGN